MSKSSSFTRDEITKKNIEFHNLIANVYDKNKEQNHTKVVSLYQNLIDEATLYLRKNNKSKLKILDLGCGSGYLEQFLDPEKNNILGIDVSEKLLNIAKRKYPNVKYKLIDVYKFKSKEKFDFIVANAFLHHLKDYKKIIKLSKVNLKPNGCIFFGGEPNFYSYYYLSLLKNILRKNLPDKRLLKTQKIKEELEQFAEYHMYFSNGINPFRLKKELKNQGFKKVKIKFSSREFFGGLEDRMNIKLIDYVPNFLLDSTWILSRIFYITAYKS